MWDRVPTCPRAAVLRDSANPAGIAQFGAIRAAAPSLGVDVSPIDVRDRRDRARRRGRSADGGLIVTGSALERHSDLIITLAARYKLPAVYNNPFPVTGGGLIS